MVPHTEVIDPAKEATCTETGLTEGKHCSVCGEVIMEQEVVPMVPHLSLIHIYQNRHSGPFVFHK